MPYTRNGESRLYYEIHGDGPPLALVMDFPDRHGQNERSPARP